jgi:transposase
MDIAKYVFQVHAADAAGQAVSRSRKHVARAKLPGFLAAQTPCVVAMDCVNNAWRSGSHLVDCADQARRISG